MITRTEIAKRIRALTDSMLNTSLAALRLQFYELAALVADPLFGDLTPQDMSNYCKILTLLSMEEEGDPVAEVRRLIEAEEAKPAPTERPGDTPENPIVIPTKQIAPGHWVAVQHAEPAPPPWGAAIAPWPRDLMGRIYSALQFYANETSYQGERTGGILAGCPRGPGPTPYRLTTQARLLLREIDNQPSASEAAKPAGETVPDLVRQRDQTNACFVRIGDALRKVLPLHPCFSVRAANQSNSPAELVIMIEDLGAYVKEAQLQSARIVPLWKAPPGWKLVPIEPTEKLIDHGGREIALRMMGMGGAHHLAHYSSDEVERSNRDYAMHAYRAMVAWAEEP